MEHAIPKHKRTNTFYVAISYVTEAEIIEVGLLVNLVGVSVDAIETPVERYYHYLVLFETPCGSNHLGEVKVWETYYSGNFSFLISEEHTSTRCFPKRNVQDLVSDKYDLPSFIKAK